MSDAKKMMLAAVQERMTPPHYLMQISAHSAFSYTKVVLFAS